MADRSASTGAGRQDGGSVEDRARAAGLRLTSPEALSLRRRRRGRGFSYLDEQGRPVTDRQTLERLQALTIPPAYRDVRIAPHPDEHIQAVGRDEAGRLQYLYHPRWEDVREAQKVEHLSALCTALPAIRRRVARALRRPALDRDKAVAAVVALIDRTHIRVGCSDYVHVGRSRGAATLLKRHVVCDGDLVHLAFHGKRRQPVTCALRAPALARVLEDLRRLPGGRMFQYRDNAGRRHPVDAAAVNRWLRDVAGAPVTAKDFRTLAATATAGEMLAAIEPDPRVTYRRRQIRQVMADVADLLGNTPAVARKSYVHRRLVEAFENGELAGLQSRTRAMRGLGRGEAMVAAMFTPDAGASGGGAGNSAKDGSRQKRRKR